MTGASGVRRVCVVSLTMQQDDGLLERQRVPDLHLAVRPLQDARRQEQEEGGCLLDALEHALLGQIVGAVVVPHLRTQRATQHKHVLRIVMSLEG